MRATCVISDGRGLPPPPAPSPNDHPRYGPFGVTHTGRRFWILDPRPGDFAIEDIAYGLARTFRYAGQSPMTVAQHSAILSYLVPREYAYDALMHDVSEAYLTDLPKGLKHLPQFAFYREIEDRLMMALAEQFGFRHPMPDAVKEFDTRIIEDEKRLFFPPRAFNGDEHSGRVEGTGAKPYPLYPRLAEGVFLDRYYELRRAVTPPVGEGAGVGGDWNGVDLP